MSETSRTLINMTAGLGIGAGLIGVMGLPVLIPSWMTLISGSLMFCALLYDLWRIGHRRRNS